MTCERALLAAMLAGAACDSYDEGIVVGVHTLAVMGEGAASSPLALEAAGGSVGLTHLNVAIESIELVECPSLSLSELLLPSAYAHSPSTPLRMGTPHILDLAAGTESTKVGELRPPPGSYCALRVVLGPADDDAVGLAAPASVMVGRTLFASGLRTRDGAGEPLELHSAARFHTEVRLRDVSGAETRLELDGDRRTADLTYTLPLSRWPDEADGDGAADALGGALARDLRVEASVAR